MTRATLKSLLIILVAFSIFVTLGWLQETIDRNELEIDRLYATTYVFGQILPAEPYTLIRRDLGSGYIRTTLAESLEASGLVLDVYYEAAMPWAFGIDPQMGLVEGVNEIIMDAFSVQRYVDFDQPFRFFYIVIYRGQVEMGVASGAQSDIEQRLRLLHHVNAISSIDLFSQRNVATTGIMDVEMAASFEIEFAPGLDETVFIYEDASLQTPIPVIMSEELMNRNGFVFGDLIAIYYFDLTNFQTGAIDYHRPYPVHIEETWERLEGQIIGVYDSHNTEMQETIFLPLSAWQYEMGADLYLTTLEFLINPELNRIDARERIESVLGSELSGYMLDIHDSELRFTVQTMEENVSLLWLLYPVVIIISLMIAAAASLFLTLQNTKNVAMMRIFGITRKRAGLILWAEQTILCLIGLILGLALLSVLGWGFGFLALFEVAGLYLVSVMIGSIIGIIMTVRQAPLELLQVRE